MTRRRDEQGFSLVESLVALAIVAAMAGMLFDTLGSQALATHDLARRREAVLLAQSLLAQSLLPGAAIDPGGGRLEDTGTWHGLVWRHSRRPLDGGARGSAPRLEEVSIEVADRTTGRRLASVQTLQLAR